MSNYIDSLSDIPKTTRYRGKAYALFDTYHLKSKANEVIAKSKKENKSRDKVANFFSVIKLYWVKNTKAYQGYYAVYWRAIYLKKPLKKRLGEIRSGKRTAKMWV